MFYNTKRNDHGLPHNPFKAIVSPRPIGWISTLNPDGSANLAPYSFFNAVQDDPPMVVFSSNGLKDGNPKDTLHNIERTKEFCVSFVSHALADDMNTTSGPFPYGHDEFKEAGLTKGESQIVKTPHVKAAPAAFECTLFQKVPLPNDSVLVIGTVLGVHINDAFIKDGLLDVTAYKPLARLGYNDYATVDRVFSLNRPK